MTHLFLRNALNLLVCIIVLSSCSQNKVYETTQSSFPENRWYQSKPVELEFDIENTAEVYDISLNLGYVYGSQFAEIPIEVYITNPLHQIEKIPYTLRLLDDNKKEIGDCAGDYCDLAFQIKSNYSFPEKGHYKIQLLNKFDYEYLPNVLSLSLKVRHKE